MSLLQAIDKTKNVPNFVNPQRWNGPQRILKPRPCPTTVKHAGFKKIEPLKKLGDFRPEGILNKSYSDDPHRLQTGYLQKTIVYNGFEESVSVSGEGRPTTVLEHPLSVKRNDKIVERCENIKKPVRYFDVLKTVCLRVFETLTYKPVKFCSDNKFFLKSVLKTDGIVKPLKPLKSLNHSSKILTKKTTILPIKSGEKSFIKCMETIYRNVKPKNKEASVCAGKTSTLYESKDENYDLKQRMNLKTSQTAGKTAVTTACIKPPQKVKIVDRIVTSETTFQKKIKTEPISGQVNLKTNSIEIHGEFERRCQNKKLIYTAVPEPVEKLKIKEKCLPKYAERSVYMMVENPVNRLKIAEKCVPQSFEKVICAEPKAKDKTVISIGGQPVEKKIERLVEAKVKGKLKQFVSVTEQSGCITPIQKFSKENTVLKRSLKNPLSILSGRKAIEKSVKIPSKSLPCNALNVEVCNRLIKPGNVEVTGRKVLSKKSTVECFKLNPHKFLVRP
ncbi:hypothetical protein LCDVSa037R [Lymphocystis disease virus 3]|uniref:Uncharacterized protein n=1 Tax=Lymphocystis disease virus 3 TaxID=2560566 RepID=A0A1B2RVV2_9VIRU|nr:hypothetical protein BZK12_gp037 [Lymphocystis disease virus Sa]AOC55121.1 hypothetical protein LCDVSa037R [Lymphocystis disease virus 3]